MTEKQILAEMNEIESAWAWVPGILFAIGIVLLCVVMA